MVEMFDFKRRSLVDAMAPEAMKGSPEESTCLATVGASALRGGRASRGGIELRVITYVKFVGSRQLDREDIDSGRCCGIDCQGDVPGGRVKE